MRVKSRYLSEAWTNSTFNFKVEADKYLQVKVGSSGEVIGGHVSQPEDHLQSCLPTQADDGNV